MECTGPNPTAGEAWDAATANIVAWLRAKGHPRLANDLESRDKVS